MATIKFSEFAVGSITTPGVMLVGLDGGLNKQFPAANLINGLATVTYVDAQDTNLQNQITQNTNDIAAIDLSGITANVSNLQGQVTVLEGNVVVLESDVAALENNVSINQNEIVTLQGNIVAIENELANIADTDAQTLTYDGANANLSISNGNNVVLQEVLDNAGNITIIQGQIADLQANGNIQTLSLDNASNVLSISGGNSVDFTTVLGNVAGGGGNPFDQNLNTTDSPTFDNLSTTGELDVNGTGTHTFEGTIQFTQITNFGGTVGITSILDEDDMVSDSATALATQQSIKAYVDANAGGGASNYGNANVTAYAEAGWSGNIIPSANVTYDLGTSTNRWKDLYLSNATIYLGDQTISLNNEGTLEFSGNISAQNIIDETSLIIHGGTINTTQVGTTDGLEWEAFDLPGGSWATVTTKMATNGSGILAVGNSQSISFSKDGGETWQAVNPRTDLGFASSMSNIRVHYISAIDTFFIGANQGYYITTQDFVTYSSQLRVDPNGWNGIQDVADDGTTLVVISGARIVHYVPIADLSNQAGWSAVVNNLFTGGGQLTYNGTRFVIIEYGQTNVQSSTDGSTWVDLVASGVSSQKGIAHDETGKIVVVGANNTFAVSTDDGVTWTTTDISSQVEWGATTGLSDVAYGDGLWVVSGYAKGNIQYVSQDLITWTKIETNAIGQRDITYMSYTGDAFYGQNQDGNYKLDWPVGKQLLLFNSNVIATRSDISYVVTSAKISSQTHSSTAWLTITPNPEEANANVSNISHGDIVFNESETSLDITANSQPVARITSGVLVQVHGSWDASSAGSFSWANDEIASHGINTVTRDGAGIYTVEFETPFATNAYTVTTGCGSTDYSGTGASPRTVSVLTRNAGNCTVICERTDDAVNEDNLYMSLMVCGIVATQ